MPPTSSEVRRTERSSNINPWLHAASWFLSLSYCIVQGNWFKVPEFLGKFYSYSLVFGVDSLNDSFSPKQNGLFLTGVIRRERECDDCVIFDFKSSPLLGPDESPSLAHVNTCSVQGMTRSLFEKFHAKTLPQPRVFATIGCFHDFTHQMKRIQDPDSALWAIMQKLCRVIDFPFFIIFSNS